jgi:hypothetical protein
MRQALPGLMTRACRTLALRRLTVQSARMPETRRAGQRAQIPLQTDRSR